MKTEIKTLLEGVRNGSVSVDEALLKLKTEPYEDLSTGREGFLMTSGVIISFFRLFSAKYI